jgi:hypothetical protein
MVSQDVRQLMEIRTRKYGTVNSIKSYPSALKGDAKIDRCAAAGLDVPCPHTSLSHHPLSLSLL